MTDVQENVLVEEPVKTLTDNTNNGVVNLSQAKSPESKSVDPKNLSEEERLKLREKKFGAQTDQSKKDVRAARFGTPATATSGSGATATDPSLLNKRAQRFGTSAPSTPVAGPNKELLEKRAKRFGSDASTESNGSNKPSDELLAKRKERFGETAGGTEDDTKKKLRQQRFQNTA